MILAGEFDQQRMTKSLFRWWLQIADDAAELAAVWAGSEASPVGTTPQVVLAWDGVADTITRTIACSLVDRRTRFVATKLLSADGAAEVGLWDVMEARPGDREIVFTLQPRKHEASRRALQDPRASGREWTATVFADLEKAPVSVANIVIIYYPPGLLERQEPLAPPPAPRPNLADLSLADLEKEVERRRRQEEPKRREQGDLERRLQEEALKKERDQRSEGGTGTERSGAG